VSKPHSNRAQLDSLGGGRFRVSGVLDAGTVGELLEQSRDPFTSAGQVEVDLAGVSETDSAGLALLIEWVRIAKEAGRTIRFENAPGQISALARISEVQELLFDTASAPPSAATANA
jgi:phospholipid transport system transporter-binding protein